VSGLPRRKQELIDTIDQLDKDAMRCGNPFGDAALGRLRRAIEDDSKRLQRWGCAADAWRHRLRI
jgi:hypothetical protein